MTLGIGAAGGPYPSPYAGPGPRFPPSAPGEPAAAAVAVAPGADRVELSFGSPPPEVLQEVDAAYKRVLDLAAQNRELHFSRDEETGRIIVQVRDLEGHVIRTIPKAHALDVMAGAGV